MVREVMPSPKVARPVKVVDFWMILWLARVVIEGVWKASKNVKVVRVVKERMYR